MLAAAGLAGFGAAFLHERQAFRTAVVGWAQRDLKVRTELASETLREPLETSDFRRIHAFGDECANDGVRLVVKTQSGGVFFDTLRHGESEPDSMYAEAPCGEWVIRLGMPYERVLAPFNRAGTTFVFAALLGAAGVFLVFYIIYSQSARIRELARLEKFRREFIADVSHEIRTPLTGIMCATDMLGDCGSDEDRDRLTGMIRDESKRLNALVQGILDLSRLERNGFEPEKTSVDPAELVGEAVERFSAMASAAGVLVVSKQPSAPLPRVDCDRSLVSQAIANFVANAIRHSGSRDVVVSAEAGHSAVRFVVEDHGKGIPPECAKRVFERFGRLDPARSRDEGGAGLGLAIAKRIAKLHGGSVALERAFPSGCRFILSLPR